MAGWMPENTAARVLDFVVGGTLEVVIFSDPPSSVGAATDGVAASAANQSVTFAAVTTATGARIMQRVNTNTLTFGGMLVGSDAVEGWGLFDTTLGEIVFVNDSWRPNRAFAAGGSLRVDPGELVMFGAYVPSGS